MLSLETWHDFSDPMQVVFGYPESPGTYATVFPTQVDSGASDGISVFFFIHVVDGVLHDASYSLIDIGFDGEGTPVELPAFEPDIAAMENLIFSITIAEDHLKIQSAIDTRLRRLPDDELAKARQFFRQVYDDPRQYEKYDKILREKNKNSHKADAHDSG